MKQARRRANPEKTKADRKRYHAMYREKEHAALRLWRERNRAALNAYYRRRHRQKQELLIVAEAAAKYGISQVRLYELTKEGRLTRRVYQKKVCVVESELRAYLQEKEGRKPYTAWKRRLVSLDAPAFAGSEKTLCGDMLADSDAPDPIATVLSQMAMEPLLEWIEEALSEEERLVLMTFVENDMDSSATAEELELPARSVKATLRRIRTLATEEFSEAAE